MAIRAGFIGLGNIGKPMAERLTRGGFETVVFDIREEARQQLSAAGARAAASIAEVAANAEVIGICVRDDEDVRAVIVGADGLLAHARAGLLIALHSTILPSTVKQVADVAAKQGVGVIDAPMTGAATGAESGTLTYMVGGDAALVERCRPLLLTSAAKIVHCGALGSGMVAKLCNNLIGYLSFLATFEATLLAREAGLPLDALLEVVRPNHYMNDTMLSFARFREMIETQPEQAALQERARSFSTLAEKDLAVTLAFARELGITLPGAALCQQLMARVYGVRDDKRR
ncbi:MAG: NAD(P)-dependent oxidoreductase [Deltaproteobacteria bacterium]|nr:NAD(P)-dependent oxidoreductase [Deltaproteobacteria bacterium]